MDTDKKEEMLAKVESIPFASVTSVFKSGSFDREASAFGR
jgi:hypothetical protein